MKRKIFVLLLVLVAAIGAAAMIYFHQGTKATADGNAVVEEVIAEPETKTVFSPRVDMQSWHYSKEDSVYYQLGILYCSEPTDPQLQRLAIFVPQDFMQCIKNDDETYTCAINKKGYVDRYNIYSAPFVLAAGDSYSEQKALEEYHDFSYYTDKGIIYVAVGRRGIQQGAPSAIVDLKAAIRYIRANKGIIAGDIERIFVFGTGAGATQSAIIGASGDSSLYAPYLEGIGALKNSSDAVFGVMAWSPLSSYETSGIAYEWSMGTSRRNLSAGEQQLSQKMAKEYANFINRAGFVDPWGHNLTLQASDDGYYQNGNYYDYVKSAIGDSLSLYLRTTKFPHSVVYHHDDNQGKIKRRDVTGTYATSEKYLSALNSSKPWAEANKFTKEAKVASIADFVQFFRPAIKPVGAFDDVNKLTAENKLFAHTDNGVHFDPYMAKITKNTQYAEDFNNDLLKTDAYGSTTAKLVQMLSPLYYLLPSEAGFRSSTVAPYWRIRSGIYQNETALTEEINLYLALRHYNGVNAVDFELIWESTKLDAEQSDTPQQNFVKWLRFLVK